MVAIWLEDVIATVSIDMVTYVVATALMKGEQMRQGSCHNSWHNYLQYGRRVIASEFLETSAESDFRITSTNFPSLSTVQVNTNFSSGLLIHYCKS